MIKYKILVMVLCLLGMLAFGATPASATVIDVWYTWFSTGGTKAEGDETWSKGDISGTKLTKIEEYWASGDERENASNYPGIGMFRYDIHSIDGGPTDIYDVKLYNPFNIVAVATTPPLAGTAGEWSANHTLDQWYWSTDSNPIDGLTTYFYLYTDAPRGYITGEASHADGSIFASGIVSGPVVPEPTSLLLLGSGLMGLAAFGRKKRKRKV